MLASTDQLHIQSFDDLSSVVPGLALSTVGTSQQQFSTNPEQGALASGYGWRNPQQPATDDLTIPSLAVKYNFAELSLQSDPKEIT
jgi:hypothetical protein